MSEIEKSVLGYSKNNTDKNLLTAFELMNLYIL